MTKTPAWYAKRYTKGFGWHLVPIQPGRKFPRSDDWGTKTLSDPEQAEAFYDARPDWNMGVALGPSGLCSLDIDCMESFTIICDAFGIDLQTLIADTPTIQGKAPGMRLMFKVPEGAKLPYTKLNWRPESDPTGELFKDLQAQAREAKQNGDTEQAEALKLEAKPHSLYTVFELRAATDGSQKQDVLPPSIHPDTGQPYTWITQPRADWPEPPRWLIEIWQNPDRFKPQLQAACPWAVIEEIYKPKVSTRKPVYNGEGGLVKAVAEYNAKTDIAAALESYGYDLKGRRYLSPHSSTRLPGVVLLPENKAWIHHASDPLCSEQSGRPVSPFDLLCCYEHNNDFKSAALAVAGQLGHRVDMPRRTATPVKASVSASLPSSGGPETAVHCAGPADYSTPLPWTDGKNKPLKHHDNLAEILRRLGVVVRYNVIKKEEEIIIPRQGFSVDNHANASLAWLVSECSVFNFPTADIQDFITLIADRNQYNPVATWINSKPWDGTPRLWDLIETVKVAPADQELKEILMTRWFVAAVAAAFSGNGISARGVLVFQGEQQMGKTMWFKKLVPASLNVIQDGVILRPDDKDSVKQAVSNWLVELGELDATFKKSDMAQLKAFITRDKDVFRMPYARKESSFARRTVFFGSVNPREFLHDPTGNTRFWTVPCVEIDYLHELDMQQVWAEVRAMQLDGFGYNLTAEETARLNVTNDDYASIEPIEERMLTKLDWEADTNDWVWMQATDLLLAVGVDRPVRSDTLKAAAIARKMNGGRSMRTGKQRLLLVPPKKISYGTLI